MEHLKILVSGCLLGERVRFDGGHCFQSNALMRRWRQEGRVLSVCPEVAGGQPVPREPAEIVGGSAEDVLLGTARVLTRSGEDVTQAFLAGAQRTAGLAKTQGAVLAILKQKSPSCGSAQVYDGSFSGKLRPGEGLTAACLRLQGIPVFSEDQVEIAGDYLASLET